MLISIIAALGQNRELGKNNKLLWRIKADMLHFKNLTTGHPVIMGRKTFESIGRPLPNRLNIVITRDPNFLVGNERGALRPIVGNGHRPFRPAESRVMSEGLQIVDSIDSALILAKEIDKTGEIFIIGGASIYSQAIKFADKLYLTLVKGSFDADAFFPDYSEFKKVVSREDGEEGSFKFTFLELVRS